MIHNFRKFQHLLFTAGLIALATAPAYAQTIELGTYYPAPFGNYDRLRLVPRSGLTNPCVIGTLYVKAPHIFEFCMDNGGTGIWVSVPGVWLQLNNDIYPTDTTDNQNLKVGIGTTTPIEFRLTLDKGAANPDGGILAVGTFGSGNTLTTSSTGTRLIWYPKKAAFRAGDVSTTVGGEYPWDDVNIADYSVAMGLNTMVEDEGSETAQGSVAMGNESWICGSDYAVAIGDRVHGTCGTIGDYSVAMGYRHYGQWAHGVSLGHRTSTGRRGFAVNYFTYADADDSAAFGDNTEANASRATALGRYNVIWGDNVAWTPTDPLFSIGNGDSTTRSDAFVVLKNGKVGINVPDPTTFPLNFKLTLDQGAGANADGGILAIGTYDSGSTLAAKGAGTRFIWYPKRAAFRAGGVDGVQWDDTVANPNIGNYSVAMGYNTTARNDSIVMGYNSTGTTGPAIAMGDTVTASNQGATAMGSHTTASGSESAAFGNYTLASATNSAAFGDHTTASGSNSTAMGHYTTARAYASLVIGQCNVVVGTENQTSWSNADSVFIIGNGAESGGVCTSPTSNALKVLKTGDTTIGGVLDTNRGLIVEMRTTDPGGAAVGRIWLCTDAGIPCDPG